MPGEAGGGLLGEAGLSRAARSGERDQSGPVQFETDGVEFEFPAHERGEAGAEVAGAFGRLRVGVGVGWGWWGGCVGGGLWPGLCPWVLPGPCSEVPLRSGPQFRSRPCQQFGVQGAEFRAGVGAEAVGQGAAGGFVCGEGVGGTARVAQGADEEGVQRFVVRVCRGQFLQVGYRVPAPAQSQVRLDTRAGRLQAQGLRAGAGGAAVREVGEGRAAPQGEGRRRGSVQRWTGRRRSGRRCPGARGVRRRRGPRRPASP